MTVPETFLDTVGLEATDELRRRGTVRQFKRGAALAHANQLPDRVFVLMKGHVKVTQVTDQGRDVLLALRGPGDLIGEQGALDGEPRSASIVALEPVEALTLTPDDFLNFVTTHPEAARYVMRVLAMRLRDADTKRVEHTAQDVLGRLALRLEELCDRCGETADDGSVHINLPLTQEDLASWASASREAISRALQQMRELGWVTPGRRSMIVHDLDAVRARARQ